MDYAGNSKKEKESEGAERPDKVIEKVIVGEVVVRKKPIGRRVKDIFFAGDFKNAVSYVGTDVLLPSIRNFLWDALMEGGRRMIYGEGTGRMPGRRVGMSSRVTYNQVTPSRDMPYIDSSPLRPSILQTVPRPRRNSLEVILESRDEAEMVLERLTDIIDKYDVASMADLNELLGRPSPHVDNKWGWSVLNNVVIRQIREGYLLDLPQADPL